MNQENTNIDIAKNLFDKAKELQKQGQIIAALNTLNEAKNFDPNNLHIWEFLAFHTMAADNAETIMPMIDQAVKIAESHNNIAEEVVAKEIYLKTIYHLNPPNLTSELIQKSCKLYADAIHKVYTPKYNFDKLIKIFHKQKNKRLKIGLVGGDFRKHAVYSFCKDVIAYFKDSKNIEIYIYMTCKEEDKMSYETRKNCTVYRKVDNLNYKQLADVIFADGINILIDVAGHTGFNRLPSFALKPAPIQASWIGWYGTTGIPEVDYFFADEFSVPSSNKNFEFSEKIYRFPNIWECYSYNEDFEKINITELRKTKISKNKNIVFGSFNNTAKATSSTMNLWCEVLRKIPESTFIWCRKDFAEIELQKKFLEKFANLGISSQRIKFVANKSSVEYFEQILQVDLILDTFPVSGMTTTAESLYLGIPTLTLLGDFMPSRCSGTCINAIGDKNLNDLLICETPEKYINQAVYFANNPQVLDEVHQTLQKKVRKSPLCDSELFAKNFEKSMWQIWNEFLEKNQQNQQK